MQYGTAQGPGQPHQTGQRCRAVRYCSATAGQQANVGGSTVLRQGRAGRVQYRTAVGGRAGEGCSTVLQGRVGVRNDEP